MRALFVVALLASGCTHARADKPPTFDADVRPLLEKKCQPCHFTGGKMYGQLPFDKADTVRRLGEKLFTRIKAEDERRVIRAFLAS